MKKFIVSLISIMILFATCNYNVIAVLELPRDHIVTEGTFTLSNANNGDRILVSGDVTLNGNKAFQEISIICADDTNLTINNVYIDNSDVSYLNEYGNTYYVSAIVFEGGVNTLTLIGDNVLKSGRGKAAVNVPSSSKLTIGGFDHLEAIGNESGAGIGGNSSQSSGVINIEGGSIRAVVDYGMNTYSHAAGIGSGGTYNPATLTNAGEINISGGTVTAIGGQGAAGIGGGINASSSTITISGDALVFAAGEQYIYQYYFDIGSGDFGSNTSAYSGAVKIEDDANVFLKNFKRPTTLVYSSDHTGSDFDRLTVTNNEALGLTFPSEWNGLEPYGYTTLRCAKIIEAYDKITYQFVRVGEKIINPGDPTPELGKEFIGWYSNNVKWDFDTDTLIDDHTTYLIATFRDIPSLEGTITFSNNSPRPLDIIEATFTPDGSIMGDLSYKWLRDGLAIPGETGASYTVVEGDIGKTISFEVTSSYEINSVNNSLVIDKYDAVIQATTPSALNITHNQVVLNNQSNCEYTVVRSGELLTQDTDWQKSTTFTGLDSSTDYDFYARTIENDLYKAGNSVGPLTLSTLSGNLTGTLTISGEFIYGETLTAIADVNAINDVWYAWYADAVEIQDGASNTYVIKENDIGKNIHCEVFDSNAGNTGLLGSVASISSLVDKSSPGTAIAPVLSSKTTSSIILEPIDGYEYKMDAGQWQSSNTFTGLSSSRSYTFTQRIQETDTTYQSNESLSVVFSTSSRPTSNNSTPTITIDDPDIPGAIIESEKGDDTIIKIESNEITVEFNGLAFAELKNKTVETKIEKVNKDDLNLSPELEKQIGDLPIFDISVYVDGNKTNFESEKPIVIEIPVATEFSEHKVIAVYVDEDGNTQIMEGILRDGVMRFITYHLSNYGIMYVDKNFTDCTKHWAQVAIEALASRDMIKGVGHDMFNPEGAITRAEFATLMVRYFDFDPFTIAEGFTDIEAGKWYSEFVWTARENNILPEIYGNNFEASKLITREEMIYTLYKSLAVTNKLSDLEGNGLTLADFSDANEISSYAKEAAEYLISSGVIIGDGHGMINPTDTSTRAEVIQMLWNMINLIERLNIS